MGAGYVYTGASETLPFATWAVSGITCATGYSGTASAAKCSGGDAYTVSGCTADCTRPTTAGYVYTGASETLPFATWAVSGITCATGYSGTASATKCSGGDAYTVSGCTLACTTPS